MLYENVLYVNYTKIVPLVSLDMLYSFYTAKRLFYNSFTAFLFYTLFIRTCYTCIIQKVKHFLNVKFLNLRFRKMLKGIFTYYHMFFICNFNDFYT